MLKQTILSIAILASGMVSAKDLKYPVNEISPALKENAHTVIRLHQEVVEIKSATEVIVKVIEARTILNKNGENNAYFVESYGALNKISGIKGKVYDEMGKQIKSLGTSDVFDRSAISGFSAYEDSRIKVLDPKNRTYPFTVEYTYEIEYKQTLFLPTWSHAAENTSYEKSQFVVKTPKDFVLRYKEYKMATPMVKTVKEEKNVYTWNVDNLPVMIDEPMSSIHTYDFPMVRLAPTTFEMLDTKGSSESWKELGMWADVLNTNKDVLPEATKAKMIEITASCKTDFEKVKKVYEYMQQKTRYVNISIGIGGWQPFAAEVVDKNSYGDCKALSNYTKALLSSVGIKSHYILVRAGGGSNLIDASFPSSQFNHAMVCVPLDKDTLWLECTNQRMPCAFNGDFTDDRDVLLVDGENSKLVHTRSYSALENCINRHSTVALSDDESGEATVKTVYTGLCYDDLVWIYHSDDADKKKAMTKRIDLPSFTLNNFSLVENKDRTPWFDESLNISVSNYINKLAGDISLLPLNFMNKLTSIPEKVRNRKSEMCIRRPYMENDTVEYKLPTSLKVTELPEKQSIKSKFGNYTASAVLNGSSITYIRHFELQKGTFPPEAYAEFRDFLEQIATADNAVASLKKI